MSEERTPYIVNVHEPADQRKHPIFRMFARSIAFHPEFVELTGSVVAAVMLSQAVYWSQRAADPAGWFYKSQAEWLEETGLKRSEQETARKHLRSFDFWQEELRKANGVPTLHYRINASRFAETLQTHLLESSKPSDMLDSSKPTCGIPAYPITEITTETTTETTTHTTTLSKKPKAPKPSDHPAVQAYRDFVERFPNKAQMKMIVESNPPLDKWIRAIRSWIGRGYNPGNIEKMLEWAHNPSLMESSGGLNKKQDTMRSRKEDSDGEIDDNGGWSAEELAALEAARAAGDKELAGRIIREGDLRWKQAKMSRMR